VRVRKAIVMPQHGTISGGRLNGWRFHFLRFIAQPGDVKVLARVTPPKWPFPMDIALDGRHFRTLKSDKAAKRLDGDKLIFGAYQLEGLPVPQHIVDSSIRLQEIVIAWFMAEQRKQEKTQ
jgi:hypothetical protein